VGSACSTGSATSAAAAVIEFLRAGSRMLAHPLQFRNPAALPAGPTAVSAWAPPRPPMSAVLVRVVGADRCQVVSTAARKVVAGKGIPIKSIPHIVETRRNGLSRDIA
jgi:hypothetical protein